MWNDFKTFIMRGNVLDLAVGIIIGAAFGKIVTSFVSDLLTPVIGLGLGKVDFSNLFFALDGNTYPSIAEAKKAGVGTINYGLFGNAVIDFLIVAFAIFLIVKLANKVQKPAFTPPPPATKDCPECTSVIPKAAKRCPQCTATLN